MTDFFWRMIGGFSLLHLSSQFLRPASPQWCRHAARRGLILCKPFAARHE
jgi:hypothetical protein